MLNIVKRAKEAENNTKSLIVIICMTLTYILLICFILPLVFSPSHNFSEEYVLSFSSPLHRHFNLISMLGGLIAGGMVSIILNTKRKEINKLELVKEVLSSSERDAVSIIQKSKEITQDSLMFRLGWSRAKISTILTNLERRNLIQRKREGKTYLVFIPKEKF